MYESFFFLLFGLDEKIEKKGRERERERKNIYHIITMMMFFYEKYTTGKAQDSEKKCADGLSDFDFFPSIKDTRYLS